MAEQNIAPTDANQFVAMINGAIAPGDSLVKITVGKNKNTKTYLLSKKILVGISPYFKASLAGSQWAEGHSQSVTLGEEDSLAFEMVVQWIYTRTVVLPRREPGASHLDEESDAISAYVEFLKLANYLQIDGPAETSFEPLSKLVGDNDIHLRPNHIREASTSLPRGNKVLRLFASACVKSYAVSRFNWDRPPQKIAFRFERELEELDRFAAELLSAMPLGGILESWYQKDNDLDHVPMADKMHETVVGI